MDQLPEVIQKEIISFLPIEAYQMNKFWNQTIKDQSLQLFDHCKLNKNAEQTKKYVEDFQNLFSFKTYHCVCVCVCVCVCTIQVDLILFGVYMHIKTAFVMR